LSPEGHYSFQGGFNVTQDTQRPLLYLKPHTLAFQNDALSFKQDWQSRMNQFLVSIVEQPIR
jgi:hypothetical protein